VREHQALPPRQLLCGDGHRACLPHILSSFAFLPVTSPPLPLPRNLNMHLLLGLVVVQGLRVLWDSQVWEPSPSRFILC